MSDSDDDDGLSAPILDVRPFAGGTLEGGTLVLQDASAAPPAAPAAAAPSFFQPQPPPQQQQQQQIVLQPPPKETLRRWSRVYPCYLEEGLTVAQGRRLPRKLVAGCAWIAARRAALRSSGPCL